MQFKIDLHRELDDDHDSPERMKERVEFCDIAANAAMTTLIAVMHKRTIGDIAIAVTGVVHLVLANALSAGVPNELVEEMRADIIEMICHDDDDAAQPQPRAT